MTHVSVDPFLRPTPPRDTLLPTSWHRRILFGIWVGLHEVWSKASIVLRLWLQLVNST